MSLIDHRLKLARDASRADDLRRAEALYSQILNDYPEDWQATYELGQVFRKQERNGLASRLLQMCVQTNPEHGYAWNDLGLCYRAEGVVEPAERCFEQALKNGCNKAMVYANFASMYAMVCRFDESFKYVKLSLAEQGSDNPAAIFTRSFIHLARGQWKNGWQDYKAKYRLDDESKAGTGDRDKVRNYSADEPTPLWDGGKNRVVVVHGEQGLGDEIMYASCIPKLIRECKQVIIHCAPRLEDLFARSFPDAVVYGGHEKAMPWWAAEHKIDYVVPMGMLPGHYRNKAGQFPDHAGYLEPCPDESARLSALLAKMGPEPKIGVAWIGGVKKTKIIERSMPLRTMEPILSQNAHFISVQYTPGAREEAEDASMRLGKTVHHWQDVIDDMDSLTALISCLDLLITVPQTAYHQAGAVNTPAWVLTPEHPEWREALGEVSAWYPNQVRFFRKTEKEGWSKVIETVSEELSEWLKINKMVAA